MKNKKQNKQKDILFILISSFILVVAWVAFNIWHIYVTSTINEHIQFQLTPINPTFDQQTMQQLKSREDINPSFVSQSIASGSSTQETVPQIQTPIPSQTPSGAPTETPSGTPAISATPNSSRFAPTNAPIGRQGQ
jgi:hypothetical protein